MVMSAVFRHGAKRVALSFPLGTRLSTLFCTLPVPRRLQDLLGIFLRSTKSSGPEYTKCSDNPIILRTTPGYDVK